jgi:hypothetical protein
MYQGIAPGTDPSQVFQQRIAQERAAPDFGGGLSGTENMLMENFRNATGQDRYGAAWEGLNSIQGDAFQGSANPNVRVGSPEQARARRELLNAARNKPRGPMRSLEERMAALRSR